jgi:GAF domain-containing protein/HAMP domain-containing protein
MKNPTPLKLSIPDRFSLGALTLRAKLILGNIFITFIAIAGTGYFVYLRAQQSNNYLVAQLDSNVRQQAEENLTSTSAKQAVFLNDFFVSMRKNILIVGATTENLLSKEAIINNGIYWDANLLLTRLPNGSWDNSNTDPASVFIPAKIDITNRLASELNTIKQLDFIVPTILAANSDTIAIYFGGTSGETLYYPNIDLASIVPPDFNVTGRPWFLKASPVQNPGKTAVWSDPYLDAALNGLVVTSSTPIYDLDGIFTGVVAMDIQLNRISDIVSNIHIGKTGYAFLIDKDKRLVAMPDVGYKDFGITPDTIPLGELFDQTTFANVPVEFSNILSKIASGESGLEAITFGGNERFVVYQPIPEVGYGLAIIVPSNEMLAESLLAKEQIAKVTRTTQTQSIYIVIGAILVISLLATLGIGNGLTLPLRALIKTAREITNGDLDAEIKVQSRDEIGTLAKTLNVMTSTLRENIQSLEQRVTERTSALEAASISAERRAAQFEVVSLITRAINSIRQTEELLPRITELISEHFGYYHVGIFLNDDNNQFAILSAANSEGGQRMLKRGHRLKIGEQGIVGHVGATGALRIARNVGEDAIFFNNPDLPETSAEMTLPLRIGTLIVGVLDVQSTQPDAFTEEDVKVLAILAEQVSLAIDNTRLFEITRRSLAEAEALSRQYLHQAWNRLTREQKPVGFRYSGTGVLPLEAPLQLTAPKGKNKRKKATSSALSIPITLRGVTIGILAVQLPLDRSWNQEQLDLVNSVAERVALAVENARLFEETTRRADRERTVVEITTKIRGTTDPQTMLTTTIEELKKVLGTNEIIIQPYIPQPSGHPAKETGTTKNKPVKPSK